jgi:predicted small secreted protein
MASRDGAVPVSLRWVHHKCQEDHMFQKVTAVVLIGTAITLAACNTVRGAAKDVNSVANCTQNAMNGGQC